MAKKIGAIDQMNNGEIRVDELEGLDNQLCAEKIAESFATVSNEYSPINIDALPCYRSTQKPPQVEEY